MSQYTVGNVNLINNSATVVGASCDWWTASNVKVGDLFKKRGENAWYQVTSVNLATNINISPVYAAASVYGVNYLVTRDFTPNYSFPEITGGDYDWNDTYTRAIRAIDTHLNNVSQGGNKWWNITGDTGTASPTASKDYLNFVGRGGITASIDVNGSVIIRYTGAPSLSKKWFTITGDTGTANPNATQDILSFAGRQGITASVNTTGSVIIRYTGYNATPTIQSIIASYRMSDDGVDMVVGSSGIGGIATVWLPSANLSRNLKFAVASVNGKLTIVASTGDTIEGNASIGLKYVYNTVNLQTDGVKTWYVF